MGEAPKRIQLRRTKGWRMPANTVSVARPTKWGNPFQIADFLDALDGDKEAARRDVVAAYRMAVERDEPGLLAFYPEEIDRLRGKNLACWCPLDKPCHADVLLEIANGFICQAVAA